MNALVVGVLAAVVSATPDEMPSLVVFDLSSRGATTFEAQAASGAVARGLRELDAFNVLSSDDLREMLSIERQKQLLGVEDNAGMSKSLEAMGSKHTVVGTVVKTAKTFQVELRLLELEGGKVLAQKATGAVEGLDKLLKLLPTIAQELAGPLLKDEVGTLLVRSAEEGAEVFIDDISRGSTPLPGPISIPRGRHRVQVKKDGFVARVVTTQVTKGELQIEDVALVPSADFATAYKERNQKMRLGAYIASGAAVAALAAAVIVDRAVAEPRYQKEFLPRQRALTAIYQGGGSVDANSFTDPTERACSADPTACRAELGQIGSGLTTLQVVSWALVGVTAVSAGFATYFWLSGDNPNRYAQVVGMITPEGGTVGVVGSF